MGLMVHSLFEIPENVNRSYYIYLLDYGWKEPLSEAIKQNFEKIADLASKTNAVFIKGTDGSHVDNEIMSWHNINGENGEEVLPAILITMENPHVFRKMDIPSKKDFDSKIILIPLRKCCASTSEVITLITKIFNDIKDKKEIKDFKIKREMKKGVGRRFLDGVILEPNFSGIGFNLKKFFKK